MMSWNLENVNHTFIGYTRPLFTSMDQISTQGRPIGIDVCPVFLVVADRNQIVLPFGDGCYPKLGQASSNRIGDMSVDEFWAMSRSVQKDLAESIRTLIKGTIKKMKPGAARKGKVYLTQEDVAKDLGVSRQTIIEWERAQTVDGPENTSNEYHYYRALRTNPELRDAYEMLVNQVRIYNKIRDEHMARGTRFRMSFISFQEKCPKNGDAKTRHFV